MANAYKTETAERRKAGRQVLQLTPETKAMLRDLAQGVPGGVSGLVTALVQQRAHLKAANRAQRQRVADHG